MPDNELSGHLLTARDQMIAVFDVAAAVAFFLAAALWLHASNAKVLALASIRSDSRAETLDHITKALGEGARRNGTAAMFSGLAALEAGISMGLRLAGFG